MPRYRRNKNKGTTFPKNKVSEPKEIGVVEPMQTETNYSGAFGKSFSCDTMWGKWKTTDLSELEKEIINEEVVQETNVSDQDLHLNQSSEESKDKQDRQEKEKEQKIVRKPAKYVHIPDLNRMSFVDWLNKPVNDCGTTVNDVCNHFIKRNLHYINSQSDININDTRYHFIVYFKYFLYLNSSAKRKHLRLLSKN